MGLRGGWSRGWSSVVKEVGDNRVSADHPLVLFISSASVRDCDGRGTLEGTAATRGHDHVGRRHRESHWASRFPHFCSADLPISWSGALRHLDGSDFHYC